MDVRAQLQGERIPTEQSLRMEAVFFDFIVT